MYVCAEKMHRSYFRMSTVHEIISAKNFDKPQILRSCSALPLSVRNSYRYENILRNREVLGHRIDAKIFPKAPSEKAQTTVSENTYTFPKIDVYRMAISSLLAPTGNNEQASFLVHQVPHTSASILRYRRMFTQFSLRVSA